MRKGKKKCKACADAAKIGKTMANKTRKSSKSLVMDGLLYGGGVAVGSYIVPKVQEMADPSGKIDPKIVNAITGAVGLFGADIVKKYLGDEAGKITLGIGIGGVGTLLSSVLGIGYVVSPSYDLDRIIGAGYDFSGTTGSNPGDI